MSPEHDWKCPECGEELTTTTSSGDSPVPPECTDCKVDMKKIFTPTPMIWKGGKPSGR